MRRLLDTSYDAAVRDTLLPLTVTRIAANTCYRFAPPFIAIIAGQAQDAAATGEEAADLFDVDIAL